MIKDLKTLQQDALSATAKWSKAIREKLKKVPVDLKGQVHFRPNSRGVSMIGLLTKTPLRGSPTFKTNLERFDDEKVFGQFFEKFCGSVNQGRSTPEKQLQAFLIRHAYLNNRRLTPISPDLIFVTDELAVPFKRDGHDKTGKSVCDILALRRDPKHGHIPVLLELKNHRAKTRLIAQVNAYSKIIDTHLELYSEIYSALLGEKIDLKHPTEKWIVWPGEQNQPDRHEAKLAQEGIRVVCYQEKLAGSRNEYQFRIGTAQK